MELGLSFLMLSINGSTHVFCVFIGTRVVIIFSMTQDLWMLLPCSMTTILSILMDFCVRAQFFEQVLFQLTSMVFLGGAGLMQRRGVASGVEGGDGENMGWVRRVAVW